MRNKRTQWGRLFFLEQRGDLTIFLKNFKKVVYKEYVDGYNYRS
jgi:hypothetical protein